MTISQLFGKIIRALGLDKETARPVPAAGVAEVNGAVVSAITAAVKEYRKD